MDPDQEAPDDDGPSLRDTLESSIEQHAPEGQRVLTEQAIEQGVCADHRLAPRDIGSLLANVGGD